MSDVNDNSPEFSPSDYVAKVRSRFPTGPGSPPILTVRATDPDLGLAGRVRYQLDGEGGDQGLFLIDETEGHVRLGRPLSTAGDKDVFRLDNWN